MANRIYEPGDFIKTSSANTFYVYEGRERINPTNGTKRYTLLAYYTPNKHFRAKEGWVTEEFLDIATKDHEVEFDFLSDHEDFSYKVVDEKEKEECINMLKEHGYEWHEETKSISRIGEGDDHYKPRIPSYEYNGEVVAVNNDDVRKALLDYARKKTEPKTTTHVNGFTPNRTSPQYASAESARNYGYNYPYGYGDDYYDDY